MYSIFEDLGDLIRSATIPTTTNEIIDIDYEEV